MVHRENFDEQHSLFHRSFLQMRKRSCLLYGDAAVDMGLAKAGAWQRGHISNEGERSPVFHFNMVTFKVSYVPGSGMPLLKDGRHYSA